MAIPRPKKKDFHVCEFCKFSPCMYVARGEVEYRTHCRNYLADRRKISNDKLTKKANSVIPM